MHFILDGLAMTERPKRPVQAYRNLGFLNSKDARELRILAEYLEPKSRFDYHKVDDTIVFMGSARLKSREAAEEALRAAEAACAGVEAARMALKMSVYYEAARSLAFRLTTWSKELDRKERRYVVCTGGGPGIMEAANRGAAEAHGVNVGLTISIPTQEFDNHYITSEQAFLHARARFPLPLLLHAQVLVPLPGEGGDRVSRRLRHARRAVRAADAGE